MSESSNNTTNGNSTVDGGPSETTTTAEGEDEFPVQVEDVNGDVVELNPHDWKLIEDDGEELMVEDIDDDDDYEAATGGTAPEQKSDGEEEGEEGEGEEERAQIIVEEDHSVRTFDGHGGEPVYSVAINPKKPNLAISGGGDDNAILWDVVTGKKKFQLTGHTDSISAVQFSNNGSYAATGSYDSTVKIWNVENGKCVQTLEGPDSDVEWISWHRNADVLLAGSKDCTVWMWLAPSGKFMQVFAGHEDEVTCGMFTSNGRSVVTASLDRTCRVWNPKDGTCRHLFQGYQWHEAGIISMDIHPSKPLVATGALDGSVRLAQIKKGKILHALDQEGIDKPIETVGFAKTHEWLASGGADGRIDVWDVSTGGCRCRFDNNGQNIVKLQWLPNQPLILSASSDAVVKLWDPRTGRAVTKLTGHADVILAMDTIVADPSYILTASDDGIMKQFEIPNSSAPATSGASPDTTVEGDGAEK